MPIKWSISNSDTKAVITMKFEDYSPEIQAKLMEIGNAAADAVESQESPAEGIPEDMHERGQSWETIGRKLGITGEATRLRYAKMERPRQ